MVIDAAGAAPEALDESQKKFKELLGKLFGRQWWFNHGHRDVFQRHPG